jgi:hypothetical protein
MLSWWCGQVLADLAVLSSAKRGYGGEVQESENGEDDKNMGPDKATEAEWKPPENQTGDGRTKLNDLLGY